MLPLLVLNLTRPNEMFPAPRRPATPILSIHRVHIVTVNIRILFRIRQPIIITRKSLVDLGSGTGPGGVRGGPAGPDAVGIDPGRWHGLSAGAFEGSFAGIVEAAGVIHGESVLDFGFLLEDLLEEWSVERR